MTRIAAFAACLTLLLAACGNGGEEEETPAPQDQSLEDAAPAADAAEPGPADEAGPPLSLAEAVNGAWRSPEARTRDVWRNPQETLEFFELDPSGTIVEIWPGGGWYTDILSPWITAHDGVYVAAWFPVEFGDERAAALRNQFVQRFGRDPFGPVALAEFGPFTGPLVEPGTADAVLSFRNVHNWMAGGYAEKAFADIYTALRPGGVLGIVAHRLPANRVQDPRAVSGYVQQDYVIALAREAGFELAGASEINANPRDSADHPFGVWTLPPVGRTTDFNGETGDDFDAEHYEAIGESDRMTLLFRKPAEAAASEAP